MSVADKQPVICIENLKNYLGGNWVHDGINLTVAQKEIVAIIGGSGCGKTTLLRSILMLHQPTSGSITVFDKNIIGCSHQEETEIKKRWGIMFQSGALFSSMTVLENVMFPISQFTDFTLKQRKEMAMLKIMMAGLSDDAAYKYPSELSGGMKKRAAIARAIVMDPELIFLDEPTAGLDPQSAGALDDLVLSLRDGLGLTVVIVTHDMDTLWYVPDRVVFLGDGQVLADDAMQELVKNDHGVIKSYFSGPRLARSLQLHQRGVK